MIILLTLVEFLCGSLMFSYWLGQMVRKNLKEVGDGNPGAFNLWSAAGYKLGITGVLLDFMKGYLPLAILIESGTVQGYGVVLIAAAPIAGHAFSPFLRFKGGKAIAVSFGAWSALTRFEVSLVYAIILALLQLISVTIKRTKNIRHVSTEADAFQAVFGMMLISDYLYLRNFSIPFFCIWLINLLILTYTNRKKLMVYFKRKISKPS